MLHGVAEEITGPFVWHSQGQGDMGSNPAMVKFQDPENNNVTTYSLWAGQSNQFQLYTTTDLHQPFVFFLVLTAVYMPQDAVLKAWSSRQGMQRTMVRRLK